MSPERSYRGVPILTFLLIVVLAALALFVGFSKTKSSPQQQKQTADTSLVYDDPGKPQTYGCDTTPTLRLGTTGACVKRAQELLNSHGAQLLIDGVYGPKTQAAVKAFHTKNHMAQNGGVIGPKTWVALLK